MKSSLFNALFILGILLFGHLSFGQVSTPLYPFQNPDLTIVNRVDDLISRLTLEEKISLMTHHAQGIERLGIPYYNWWNEALHGVARSVPATVFPQAIGLAATFDTALIAEVATAISDEARDIYHRSVEKEIRKQYMGLTFWSPNVNIFRDPRWGRGHETYGEDPFLSGEIGAAFVRGIQGSDPQYLKAAACAKHYAVHNGPEAKRHYFNAETNKKDLYETYLPAFKRLIDEGVAGVMCAYNRTNGELCCGSPTLLDGILREDWGFDGYIVSDCGALYDFHVFHKVTDSPEASAALAVKHGVNVNCGDVYAHLDKAVEQGLATEEDIDKALAGQLKIRFRLGLFDPDEQVPYSKIRRDAKDRSYAELARKAAQQSVVLLKNENDVLPLRKDLTQIYLTGNNAASVDALMGNYYGVSRDYVTIAEGIAAQVSPTTILQYNPGVTLIQEAGDVNTGQAKYNAGPADATIAVVGLTSLLEGEAGDAVSRQGGDRDSIELPANQRKFLLALREGCGDKPLIVVICSGSAIAIPEIHEIADAVIWAGYPGEQGGNAVADVIFGNVSPSGKLPMTFYRSTGQLGDFEDYRIADGGKTYKYFKGEPLYPFGFGLGYNEITYSRIGQSEWRINREEPLALEVELKNNGTLQQDEVVQLYMHKRDAPFTVPQYALKGFQKVTLAPGATQRVRFDISPEVLEEVDMSGKKVFLDGEYDIWIGSASPSKGAEDLGAPAPVRFMLTVQ